MVSDDRSFSLFGPDSQVGWIRNDVPQVGYIGPWAKERLAGKRVGNPLVDWAESAAPAIIDVARDAQPDLIVASLFCMGLAVELSRSLDRPWCFINPSFYFGEQSTRGWTDDWYGPFVPILAEECFAPLADAADLVLHATDPLFDPPPPGLPDNHHYTGFLLWDQPAPVPSFLTEGGSADWVLVTASTARPPEEDVMLSATLDALADRPVRVALTLPQENWDGPVPDNTIVTGFVPHTPILERSILCVSQAGHGIVSKCLTQGIPMALLPWDADQPGVAARAHTLGVASVVPRDDATPDAISESINDVLSQPTYSQHARDVAASLNHRTPNQAVVNQLTAAAKEHA